MLRSDKLSTPLPNRRSWLFRSLMALMLLAISARLYHVQKARAESYGNMNAQQVFARSEAICRALSPDVEGMSISVERSNQDAPLPYWEATCVDKTGKNSTYLHYDAATGNLRYAGHMPVYPSYNIDSRLSESQAIRTAWKWVEALGLADKGNLWKVQPTVKAAAGNWEVCWKTSDRKVAIMINANSGYFATAHINYPQNKV